jgi:hypothetical protein
VEPRAKKQPGGGELAGEKGRGGAEKRAFIPSGKLTLVAVYHRPARVVCRSYAACACGT